MKKIFKIVCLFLIVNCCFSCTTPAPLPGLVGEYELIDEPKEVFSKAQIISTSTGLSWVDFLTNTLQPITLISNLEFRVDPFEMWGLKFTIKGELQGNELHIIREAFDSPDLEIPSSVRSSIFTKKK